MTAGPPEGAVTTWWITRIGDATERIARRRRSAQPRWRAARGSRTPQGCGGARGSVGVAWATGWALKCGVPRVGRRAVAVARANHNSRTVNSSQERAGVTQDGQRQSERAKSPPKSQKPPKAVNNTRHLQADQQLNTGTNPGARRSQPIAQNPRTQRSLVWRLSPRGVCLTHKEVANTVPDPNRLAHLR